MKLTNLEAMKAKEAMGELSKRDDIPIRASLDVALISNMVDAQVEAYGVVQQILYKKYSIKSERSESGGVKFTCFAGILPEKDCPVGEETAKLRQENLEAFGEKFKELLEAKTEDLSFTKIKLPDSITIKPEILKALTEFITVV